MIWKPACPDKQQQQKKYSVIITNDEKMQINKSSMTNSMYSFLHIFQVIIHHCRRFRIQHFHPLLLVSSF